MADSTLDGLTAISLPVLGTDLLAIERGTSRLNKVAVSDLGLGMANPMTTGGDVIYGGASGAPTRLANGTAGQVLTSGGTTVAPTWSAAGAGDALKADPLSQFAATTSAQLRGVISDETGTGLAYFQGGDLGTPSAGVLTNCTFPTLNQNTTGSAASLTNTRTIGGSNFNGTANVTSFPSAGAIGGTTPAAGTFTTLVAGSATSLILGTAGTAVGSVGFNNATSGTATVVPPTGALGTYNVTLPNAASTLPIFGQQITFAGPTAARTVTLPDAAFTVARTDAANTFTGTQTIGALTVTTVNGNTFTTGTGVLTIAAAKTLTANNTLTLAGTDATTMTFPTTSATIARTDAANTFTGVQTITNLTLPTAGQIKLTVPTGDLTATGPTCGDFNSGYSSSAIGDLVYLDSSATWQKTDANTLALYNGLLGIALEVKASGNALLVALPGSFVYSTTGFPTWTIGSPIYMSETAGAMTQTAPTTTDAATRIVGWGIHADKLFFFPSPDYLTHT